MVQGAAMLVFQGVARNHPAHHVTYPVGVIYSVDLHIWDLAFMSHLTPPPFTERLKGQFGPDMRDIGMVEHSCPCTASGFSKLDCKKGTSLSLPPTEEQVEQNCKNGVCLNGTMHKDLQVAKTAQIKQIWQKKDLNSSGKTVHMIQRKLCCAEFQGLMCVEIRGWAEPG